MLWGTGLPWCAGPLWGTGAPCGAPGGLSSCPPPSPQPPSSCSSSQRSVAVGGGGRPGGLCGGGDSVAGGSSSHGVPPGSPLSCTGVWGLSSCGPPTCVRSAGTRCRWGGWEGPQGFGVPLGFGVPRGFCPPPYTPSLLSWCCALKPWKESRRTAGSHVHRSTQTAPRGGAQPGGDMRVMGGGLWGRYGLWGRTPLTFHLVGTGGEHELHSGVGGEALIWGGGRRRKFWG